MEAAWRERGAELGQQTPYGPDGPPTQSPDPDPTVDSGTSAAVNSALSTDPTLATGP